MYNLTDLGNAERFVSLYGRRIRYVPAWRSWYVWTGTHWAKDERQTVIALATEMVRAMQREADEIGGQEGRRIRRWADQCESNHRIKSFLELAAADPRIVATPSDFDNNPWTLNLKNGLLDLRTGELHPHQPTNMVTVVAGGEYSPTAEAPQWRRFLNNIMPDPQVRDFVQAAVGYSLSGSVREQVLFILYGAGANGKSTFLEVLRALMGDYARAADPNLLLVRRTDGIRNDLARLRGARFVTAVETGIGRELDSVMVKQLTGKDTITARFLYQEAFELRPSWKLWFATNNRPTVVGSDPAIWRRIRLIEFPVVIPPEKQDLTLQDRIVEEELAGVLNWALEGFRRWYEDGLPPAVAVEANTSEYRDEVDSLSEFIQTRCLLEEGYRVSKAHLYNAYVKWCTSVGEVPLSRQAVAEALRKHGVRSGRTARSRYWEGIRVVGKSPTLRPSQMVDDDNGDKTMTKT